MLRRQSPHRFAAIAALLVIAGAVTFFFCSKNNPVSPQAPSWALTIDVQDGYTGNKIASARVQFMTDSLQDTAELTNSQGRLKIDGLSSGTQSFKISNSDTTVKYTDAIVSASSVADSLGKLNDVSVSVKLFPLTGSISGRIQTQINPLQSRIAARGVVVSVSYDNADLDNVSPKAFQVSTDSMGAFSLTGLPVATGCKVTIAPATLSNIDFKPDSFAQPLLVSKITVPLGTILMRPIDASNFKQMTEAPLVIAPNQTISITYSDALDSVSYATLEGVGASQSVIVTSSVRGNAITITPSISLVDGSQYYLTVYAFGKTGGDTTSKTTLLVKGGGLIDVVSSNVLDGNKQAVDGLGLSDSMVFTFKAAISKASATITQSGTPILVTTSFKGSTLTVKPQGNWQSTTYLVKISATLVDSTTSSFSFSIATVGGLAFLSSNIYNPQTLSPINGLGFSDTITVTTNKAIVSAVATMSQASVPVPMSVTETGSVVKIVPYDNLRPATSYAFSITVTTSQGETKSFSTTFTTASTDFYPIVDNIRFDNDPTKPVLNFAPNGTIFIKMSSTVKTATAQINGGTPEVNVTINADTIKIAPVTNLSEGVAYNLKISASNAAGTVYNENNGNFVTGFYVKSAFLPITDNIRFGNDPSKPVLDFPSNGIIIIKMSDLVKSASAQISGGTNPAVAVTCNADSTIRITPQVNLTEATSYTLKISAQNAAGVIYNNNGANYVTGFQVSNAFKPISDNIRLVNDPTKPVLNFVPNGTIIIKMSATVQSASAQISGGINPAVTVTYSNDTVSITPQVNLAEGTSYNLTVSIQNTTGTVYNANGGNFVTGFQVSNPFKPLSDNIRLANDPTKPVQTFAPNGTIVIKMTANVQSASAQITGTGNPAVIVAYSHDTVKITPQNNLVEGTSYNLTVSIQSATGLVYNANGGNFVTGFQVKNSFSPVTSNVRFNNSATQPVLDFAPNGVLVIVMSDSVQSATALLTNVNGSTVTTIQSDVRVSGDTIRVVPQDLLGLVGTYTLNVTTKSSTGLTYQASPFVQGLTVQNKVRVLASNVLSADGLGLSDIPVTSTLWYLLSSTPDATTLSVTLAPATTAVVTVSGDTIKVKPVNNLADGTAYGVTISGKTMQGNIINIDLNTSTAKQFTTRIAAYIVATNMRDASNNPVSNLLPTTELWIKFSRPLAAATSQQLGGGAAPTITYTYGAASNNATVRVNNDTLFAKFMPNALPGYGATISLKAVNILFTDATTLGAVAVSLTANIMSKLTPYVLATNGIVNNVPVDTFGALSESWIVSSMSFRSVDAVKNGPDGMTNVPAGNLVLTNVRTHGDTIFFRPSVRLSYSTQYQVAFEVTLADSTKYTGTALKLSWKTQMPLSLVSANDMNAGFTAYRPFGVTGDSLVLTFSKAIDLTKSYSVANLVTRLTYSWSSDAKTLTVKPVDTLKAENYSGNLDYTSVGTNYNALTVSVTAIDGEPWTTKATNVAAIFNGARPALAIRTVPGIEVLNTNLKVSNANKSVFYVNSDNTKLSTLVTNSLVAENDSVNVNDTLKVYFSTAVDSSKVASTPGMVLLTNNGGIPQNVAISYSTDHKTMFIKPAVALFAGAAYTLALTNVQALGMLHSGDANAVVSYAVGSALTFKTRPSVVKVVKDAAINLRADTALSAIGIDNKVGYSGSKSNAYGTGIASTDVADQNKVKLMWYEIDFRSPSSAADTVSAYQLSVKGIDGNWYDLQTLVAASHYNPFSPLADSIKRYILDLSAAVNDIHGVNIGPALRIASGTNYQNDPSIFNYGATLQVRIRTVLGASTTWDASYQVGSWSTPITFKDNTAPCDSNFVAKSGTLGNLNTVAKGGVSVTTTAVNTMVRTVLGDGYYTFDFNFPEDMDTSSSNAVPTIQVFYSQIGVPTDTIGVVAASSYWTNAYTYHMTVRIPGGVDWTAAWIPYYALSIVNVKDNAGNPIQTQQWSSVGTASSSRTVATPLGAVINNKKGTTNLIDLTAF